MTVNPFTVDIRYLFLIAHPDTLTEMVTKVLPTDVGLVHQVLYK